MFNLFKHYPRIGIALGGGAARGFAHIGVLKVLENHGVRISALTGVSVGSIIGALYACGYSAQELEEVAYKVKWSQILSLTPNLNGFASNKALAHFLTEHFSVTDFKHLKIPFRALATDICTGNSIVYKEGLLTDAIRASCQFPGVFAPLKKPLNMIFDGGLVENVPVSELASMHQDIIIAVDVIPRKATVYQPANVLQIIDRSVDLLLKANSAHLKKKATFYLEPVADEIYSFDIDKVERLIQLGTAAAEQIIPYLQAKL